MLDTMGISPHHTVTRENLNDLVKYVRRIIPVPLVSGDRNAKDRVVKRPRNQMAVHFMAYKSSWWFQPISKILVKLDHFSK